VASLRIVNASPLILLGKIGHLALLDVGDREVVVPEAVIREVEEPSRPGRVPERGPSPASLRLEADVPIPPEVRRLALDPGESMVLALALSLRGAGDDVEVVLDERKGRRAALTLGLAVVGTAGLLVLAKAAGRIPAVAPVLDELEWAGMYFGAALRREILEVAEE
jgi:predicted nucleic acid-binding protein